MAITNGRPDGYTTLTPFLVCSPAAEAIRFYGEVFGATVVNRMEGPGGTVVHAELDFGSGRLQLRPDRRVPAQSGDLGRLRRAQHAAGRRLDCRVPPRRHVRSLGMLSDMTITDGKPEGYTTLTPFLVCAPAADAIRFYGEVFGATVVSRMDGPDGTVLHAELDFGNGRLQLSDPNPEYGLAAPVREGDTVSRSTCIYVPDVDAVFAAAVERGATVREAPATFVTGDRFASLYDPFGHRWAVMTRVEDVSPEEAERRLSEWASSGGL